MSGVLSGARASEYQLPAHDRALALYAVLRERHAAPDYQRNRALRAGEIAHRLPVDRYRKVRDVVDKRQPERLDLGRSGFE